LPKTYVTSLIEDAVALLKLDDEDPMYIEKHHSEFTQKHNMYGKVAEAKDKFFGNHLNRDALDIHGGDILESDKINPNDMNSNDK
jgi:hypothetical protein